MANVNNYLEYINENAAEQQRRAFIDRCETGYRNKLKNIVSQVNGEPGREILLLAGPSSSGKTTTANILKEEFTALGHQVFTISLDDYYKNKDQTIFDENGKPDYETVHALDLGLLTDNLQELMQSGRTEKPIFDFQLGKRLERTETVQMGEGDIVIVEGLHALNPLITEHLSTDNLLKLYVNLNSRIYTRSNKIVLNKRNIRFVRRMIRDYHHRASSVENTLELWDSVVAGEDKYLFPFADQADIKINSLHLYEVCVFRDQAIEMLGHVGEDSPYYKYCTKLIHSLKKFDAIPEELVPETSLLQEFLCT